jgi:hypothetical protein
MNPADHLGHRFTVDPADDRDGVHTSFEAGMLV